jgi:hypothetical protein
MKSGFFLFLRQLLLSFVQLALVLELVYLLSEVSPVKKMNLPGHPSVVLRVVARTLNLFGSW